MKRFLFPSILTIWLCLLGNGYSNPITETPEDDDADMHQFKLMVPATNQTAEELRDFGTHLQGLLNSVLGPTDNFHGHLHNMLQHLTGMNGKFKIHIKFNGGPGVGLWHSCGDDDDDNDNNDNDDGTHDHHNDEDDDDDEDNDDDDGIDDDNESFDDDDDDDDDDDIDDDSSDSESTQGSSTTVGSQGASGTPTVHSPESSISSSTGNHQGLNGPSTTLTTPAPLSIGGLDVSGHPLSAPLTSDGSQSSPIGSHESDDAESVLDDDDDE